MTIRGLYMNKKVLLKYLALLGVGGSSYVCIELLWRGYSDISMFLCGGICFIIYGILNEFENWEMPLLCQLCVGATCVTIVEFIFGLILNIWLKINIWDYSDKPYNLLGQICLVMWFAWLGLGIIAIPLDDWIRHIFFVEERPHYTLLGYKKCNCKK